MSWPRPSLSEVERFRRGAPRRIPEAYIDFLMTRGAVQLDVPNVGSGLVWFWELADVLEFNHGYGFAKWTPGLFGFGSDGAGALYAFDLRDPTRVTVGDIEAIPMEIERFRVLANSFEDFAARLASGTPA